MLQVKQTLRDFLKQKRSEIPESRKRDASKKAFSQLKNLSGNILSFASFGTEIDLWELNNLLALQRRLILPKVEKESLMLYQVTDLSSLQVSSLGILEPNPTQCKAALHMDHAFVPGLGFDKQMHRIGYGKGYYDRLLPTLLAKAIGVGFKEQLVNQLPVSESDFKLSSLCLF